MEHELGAKPAGLARACIRWLACLTGLCLIGLVAGAARAAPPPKLAVLILTGQNNHDWQATTPVLKQILEASGRFTVDVTEHPEQCTAASLARYDALLSNWNEFGKPPTPWPEAARSGILDFVRNGKGFVVVHAGSSSFYDWPEYQQMVGATWANGATSHGPIHRFFVQVTDPDNPITHGMRIFLTQDELWNRTGVQPGNHPLATAYSAPDAGGTGHDEPLVFVHDFGKGHCFDLMLGHNVEAMQSAGFQALLCRGTEWAATGQVTLPPGNVALNSQELDYVLSQVRTYQPGDRRDALWMLEYHVGLVANTPQAAATAARLAVFVADAGATPAGRQWACRQLSLIATSAEVPALAALLSDKDLGVWPRFVLERIPGEAALAALRTALGKATGTNRVGLIDALGSRRDPDAAQLIARSLGDPDIEVAQAAMLALGRIGTGAALQALNANERSVPVASRPTYLLALLQCAAGLESSQQQAVAAPVFRKLTAPGMPAPVRTAAFVGILQCDPIHRGALLLAALKGADQPIRLAASHALADGGSAELVDAAAAEMESLPPDAQVQVIDALKRRRDNTALPAITSATASHDTGVRVAAISALGALGGAQAAPALVKAAAGASRDEQDLISESLAGLQGPDVDPAITAAAESASPAVIRVLMNALVARSARATAPALLALASRKPGALQSIIPAVGSLGDLNACGPLLALLQQAGEDDRPVLEAALASICSRANSVGPVMAALPASQGAERASLITVLGTVGGPDVIAPLRDALKSTTPAVCAAAAKALGAWPDATPLDDLVSTATTTTDPVAKALAIRGAARLAGLASNRPADAVVSAMSSVFAISDRPEEKQAILSGLGKVPCQASLKFLTAHLKDPGLEQEAGLAALQVANSTFHQYPDACRAVAQQLAGSTVVALKDGAASLQFKLDRADNLALGATASHPDGLGIDGQGQEAWAAIDGDPKTYWDEDDFKDLYILRVQLQAPSTISVIRIMGYEQENYAPKDFEILCDDKVIKKVVGARYQNNWLMEEFPATKCSVLELRITGYYGQSPAIRELEIYSKLPAGVQSASTGFGGYVR
jgi:type 1 glutamine amidotransferase/HEAT repeat protein